MFDRFRFDAKRPRSAVEEGDGKGEREDEEGVSVASADGAASAVQQDEKRAKRVGIQSSREKRVKPEPQLEPSAERESAGDEATLPARQKWQERWHAICTPCFDGRIPCSHFREQRMRLMIIGHNPSDHAWESGFSYSNPTNRFWSLLRGSLPPLSWRGILPSEAHIGEQNTLPLVYGVGLTSIGLEPGNDAAAYGRDTMARWRDDFFRRLRRHVQQVCINEHGTDRDSAPCPLPHSPLLIAFSGKRQFSYLFTPPLAKVEHHGRQTTYPSGWPRECRDSELWVLPSSSGRAAMTTAQRAEPYRQLADRFHQLPWPLAPVKDEE